MQINIGTILILAAGLVHIVFLAYQNLKDGKFLRKRDRNNDKIDG